jgi:hypothetical protein
MKKYSVIYHNNKPPKGFDIKVHFSNGFLQAIKQEYKYYGV